MITFFTTFKQCSIPEVNAVTSWLALHEQIEVLIFTETDNTSAWFASDRVSYNKNFKRHATGLPLLNSIFEEASRCSKFDTLCYCNSDIIITKIFLTRILAAIKCTKPYLIVSQRLDLDVSELIEFNDTKSIDRFTHLVASSGRIHPPYGSDIFLFSRGQYSEENMPDLLVGRPGWDNWMIYDARIRFNNLIQMEDNPWSVIHQNHPEKYNHTDQKFLLNYEYLPSGHGHTFILAYRNFKLVNNRLMRANYVGFDLARLKWELRFSVKRSFYYWLYLSLLFVAKYKRKWL